MGANANKVLHVDARNFPVYDTADLDYFQKILNDIMDEHEASGCLSLNDREYLMVHLAAAIFKSVEAGERDYERLKRSAIEAVSPVPLSDP